MSFAVRQMTLDDVDAAAALQRAAFPAPFPEDLLWQPAHLRRHLAVFPAGQFVAEADGAVVATCSNTIVTEAAWNAHASWDRTVGGPYLENFAEQGSTLYGLDITVHPDFRRRGIGRRFYEARFTLVRELGLVRYGTACRIPDYLRYRADHPEVGVEEYVIRVVDGQATDRTLTPLLRYGLRFLEVLPDYMEDEESANAAALLEWRP